MTWKLFSVSYLTSFIEKVCKTLCTASVSNFLSKSHIYPLHIVPKQLHNRALSIVVPEQLHNWAGFQYCVVIVWQLNKYHLLRSALVTFANVFEFLLICGMNHSFKAEWFQRGQLTSNLGWKHWNGTKLFWKPKFGFNQRCSLKALKKDKVVL